LKRPTFIYEGNKLERLDAGDKRYFREELRRKNHPAKHDQIVGWDPKRRTLVTKVRQSKSNSSWF